MKHPDVKPTIKVILGMVKTFRQEADELENIADRMASSGDISYVAEALNVYQNLGSNVRIDLLVTRPIREYENILKTIKEKK